jgi:chloride channel protein, CIC family
MRLPESGPKARGMIVLSALAVGIIAGFGAVVFRGMIAGIHNLFFLGRLSFDYDANVHTPASPWGFWIIFVPVLGAVGVAFLVKTFAPEAKGHGVPEVMDAIYYQNGKIR